MAKDAPNHILMNMLGLDQTSREILEDGDILIFPVVLISLIRMVLITSPKLAPHYPPYEWRLIQSVYDRMSVTECEPPPPLFRGI